MSHFQEKHTKYLYLFFGENTSQCSFLEAIFSSTLDFDKHKLKCILHMIIKVLSSFFFFPTKRSVTIFSSCHHLSSSASRFVAHLCLHLSESIYHGPQHCLWEESGHPHLPATPP